MDIICCKMDINIIHVLLCCVLLGTLSESKGEQACLGSSYGLTHGEASSHRYDTYKHRYENCTFVDGNLEIVFLEEEDNYDLNFLSHIKEVTGYVLISSVFAQYVPLSSLKIIRGEELFKARDGMFYSLYVSLNYKPGSKTVGLKELRFVKLYEILHGNVFFFNNNMLCYENTIRWRDILTNPNQNVTFHSDTADYKRACGKCSEACTHNTGERHCWGGAPGSDMCQIMSQTICAEQCDGRCYGELPNQCCHVECVGGCTGPTSKECVACKNFNNDGLCVPFCPQEKIYDAQKYKYVPNPNAKYTYGTLCVDKCPVHLVVDMGACVRDCGPGRTTNNESKCVECDGACPKKCVGTEAYKQSNFINAQNIKNFTGCTIINGDIRILANTFNGDGHFDIPPMHPSQLSVLESVREINGYLMIQGEHAEFRSLGFFKNLEKIHGRSTDQPGYSLHIYDTTLTSLDLMRLTTIANGMVLVNSNEFLCYAETIQWRRIMTGDPNKQIIRVSSNQQNETCHTQEWTDELNERRKYKVCTDNSSCSAEGHVCSPECSSDGCWGAGEDHCLSCRNYIYSGKCVESCDHIQGVYNAGDDECKICHEECQGGCYGPGANECVIGCKNFRDGPYCVEMCPNNKYPDATQICQPCHENCVTECVGAIEKCGCTGPHNTLGENACNSCEQVMLDLEENVVQCMKTDTCDIGYFSRPFKANTMQACARCHPLCKECWGSHASMCEKCIHLMEDSVCVQNCSIDHYQADDQCHKCDSKCIKCYGATASECLVCKSYKVYSDDGKSFNCTDKCPDSMPYKTGEKNKETGEVETVCTGDSVFSANKGFVRQRNMGAIVGSVVSVVIVIGLIIIVVAVYCQKRAKAMESKERLAARMSGLCEESEFTPLTPTDAKPDMSILRLIKESELRKGTMVGSGAFGTVYKGFWIPGGENVKIPVAIKVLQEGTSTSQNHELLEEARVMASVDNRYCVPILGVCMTAQMMLITPYMPLGCLLDYVRKNRDNIGSKVLLDWCTQIATGMSYLESLGIVHRDLAARNVLVQNPKRVRVTDFGLSKLLDVNTAEYHATGGKMPIKWLALECMQHRVFTHKSDVWSFGVAIWELFTYGSRPYENIRARDIPELLEKGERLPQPPICTIDVYMIMIKCWMLDAQSRPGFKDLAEEFSKMARDPGRYLVIQGDRLMRLPSHSQETKKIMFRNMSVSVDGPEEIIEAEEYLMPGHTEEPLPGVETTYRPRNYHHRSNGKLEKVKEENSGSSNYDNDRSRHPSAQPPNPLDQLIQPPPSPHAGEKKYSGLEHAAAMRKQREAEQGDGQNRDSVKTRYSSDPCQILAPPPAFVAKDAAGGGVMEDNYLPPAPPTPIRQGNDNVFFPPVHDREEEKGAKGGIPERLPVDEDDYLQPQSQSYMPKYIEMQEDYLPPAPTPSQPLQPDPHPYTPAANYPQYPGGAPAQGMPMFAENPEYFDSPGNIGDDQVNISIDQGIGPDKHPLTASYNKNSPYNPYNNMGDNKNVNNPLRLKSTESSDGANSEHDYYNDTDYLNKSGAGGKKRHTNSRTESVV